MSIGNIAFVHGNRKIYEWNRVLLNEIKVELTNAKIRKFIIGKLESSLAFLYGNESLVFVNEMHTYDDIINTYNKLLAFEQVNLEDEKNDYARCCNALKDYKVVSEKTNKYIENDFFLKKQIPILVKQLKDNALKKCLIEIPIDQLNVNKEGIRISALKEAGISNVQLLLEKIETDHFYVRGIGEQSTQLIIQNIYNIKSKAEKNVRIYFDAEKKSNEHTKLLKVLYTIIKSQETRKTFLGVKKNRLDQLQNNYLSLILMRNFSTWYWATAEEKKDIITLTEKCNLFFDADDYKQLARAFSVYVDIQKVSNKNCWIDYENNTAPYYALLEGYLGNELIGDSNIDGISKELFYSIKNNEISTDLMKSSLRNYQLFGVQYIMHQKNVLLGDEMGLGKTIQAIAAITQLNAKGKNRFLIICPLSVLVNWCREIKHHSHMMPISIYGKTWRESYITWKAGGLVGVTTYETINKFNLDEQSLIEMLVVDEAHYIKNPKAGRTINLLNISKFAKYKLFMTGTPLENKVEEMCFLISCLQPKIGKKINQIKELAGAQQFKHAISPVYLRRVRKDVLNELPELIESEEWGIMNSSEKLAYKNSVLNESFMSMRRISWNVENIDKSTKANRLVEICNDAKNEGRKIVIFSYFRDVLDRVKDCLQDKTLDIINGSISSDKRQKILDEFEISEPGTVLISQIISGGTGLNIQCASVVILCEPQLKPSIENQAISRVYRMGQAHTVEVHRLLIENSVDERIMALLSAKQKIFDAFADESEAAKNEEDCNYAVKILLTKKRND